MIDINLIRKDPESVRKSLLKRMGSLDLGEILREDERNRELKGKADSLREQRRKASAEVAERKRRGEDPSALLAGLKELSADLSLLEKDRKRSGEKLSALLSLLPNIPAGHVPAGGKENNREIRRAGAPRDFSFPPRDHMALAEDLDLIDYKRGAKLAGSGHWIYKNRGALLEWALLNFFVEFHGAAGYEFILPPHMLNYECGYAAGQFPKFDEDVYYLEGEGKRFILPTAETALANYHRDEILSWEQLPARYFSYTPCYRKEAGSYRSEERGMIRGHQFNKVEMFQYCRPEDSGKALEEMIGAVEDMLTRLELHYRVTRLAAGDCSAAMAETVDMEVWIPSMGGYKEVSSASNANDYQARRGKIRYRDDATGRNRFVHTLNASGLATSRLIPALLEQHQNGDGSVSLPKVLRGRWGLPDRLEPAGP